MPEIRERLRFVGIKALAVLRHFIDSFLPNRRDNIKQICIKILFMLSLVTLIASSCYLLHYFITAKAQHDVIAAAQSIWHNDTLAEEDKFAAMLAENPDFKGWLSISNTQIDNPVYQTTDDSFYLTHNQKKEYSRYGALFLSCDDLIGPDTNDKNLVIYGHEMRDGSMFGSLKKLRQLAFYQQNPVVSFSTPDFDDIYKIYAVFVLNADAAHDDNYIYNIKRDLFSGVSDFKSWVAEAQQRSILNTGVDVEYNDDILTLVTCCEDFDNARLVVMARKCRIGESTKVDTSLASVNPAPRYPHEWYTKKKMPYPFADESSSDSSTGSSSESVILPDFSMPESGSDAADTVPSFEPSSSDAAPSEPTPSAPSSSAPTSSAPAAPDPTPSNPAPSEPVPSEPVPSEPVPSEPVTSDPTPSEPEPSDPTPSEPAPSDPVPSEPAPSDS